MFVDYYKNMFDSQFWDKLSIVLGWKVIYKFMYIIKVLILSFLLL